MSRNDQPVRRDDNRTGKMPVDELGGEQGQGRGGQLTDEEIEQQAAAGNEPSRMRDEPSGQQHKKGNQPR